MRKRRGAKKVPAVRTIDIPVPPSLPPVGLLASRLRSGAAADRALIRVVEEMGLPADVPRDVSAAIALTRLGVDLDRVARSLAWREFEDYCAMAISAAGYAVKRNVRLRKPTRQIDIIAESPSLVLSIDCKHWKRGAGGAALGAVAVAQAERTRIYMERSAPRDGRAFLPVVLTMLDSQLRVVGGVPVVPLGALRGFLTSVSAFDGELRFIRRGDR